MDETETKVAADLPCEIDELDALKLAAFYKDAENLRLQLELLRANRALFDKELADKYKVDAGKDQIDLATRKITRG